MSERLGLSFQNSRELNRIIDEHLPSRPKFERHDIVIEDETFQVYFRDIMDCIALLYGNPEFAPHLTFAPECHYSDTDKKHRIYHDMYTGKWWWETQVHIMFHFVLMRI
jgi:Plavaka transposase